MTRPLEVVDSADLMGVIRGLKAALNADGPAILPHALPGSVTGLPATVEQRIALVIETSGSTGAPKRVALGADALLASAAAADAALGGPGDWLLALPLTYIAGINVVVRSFASDTEIHAVRGIQDSFRVDSFLRGVERMGGERRYTSLVPTQLSRLMAEDAGLDALGRFDRILVGGQAMPVELAARALEAGLNITRTYGSSETSGGCLWDGVPIGNTVVDIADGRVELSGSVLAEGYLSDPERTAFAFRERDGRRWYRTDDSGELVDGILKVTGRVDDVIISGGIKVSIAEVEAAVRGLPGLGEAVVVPVPSAEWGEVPVVVSAVARPLDEVRAAVASTLGAAAAPSRILLVDRMPLLPSGKPDRLSITALALK